LINRFAKYRWLLLCSAGAVVLASLLWIEVDASTQNADHSYPMSLSEAMYFTDSSDQLQAADVLALPDSVFFTVDQETPNFGFFPGSVWLIARLPTLPETDRAIVEIKNPLLNKVEIFEVLPNGLRLVSFMGDDELFEKRLTDHRYFQIPYQHFQNPEHILLIRASSAGEQLALPIQVWSAAALRLRDENDILIRGLYFGLILFVLLFNVFIYFVIKEKSSLHYVLYNFFLLGLQFSLSGLAYQYLWPKSPYLANVANPFFASMAIFALLHFTSSFLNLKYYYPKINKIFFFVGWLLVANACASLLYQRPLFDATILVVNGFTLVLNIVILPVVIAVRRRNFVPAKFFLLAFVVLVITVFLFILTNFGVFHIPFFSDYGLLVGSAAEVILLSFAIVDRFKAFKEDAFARLKEINRLTEESNEILEKKVVERTYEIERQKEEIISSIRYAERLQQSLLPTDEALQSTFPESFVFYRPKDIVSGDFYWIGKKEVVRGNDKRELLFFAAADCTGHGVPGAFMSVMGINFMEQVVLEHATASPGEVLDVLNKKICDAIRQREGNTSIRDGMDVVLGAIDPIDNKLFYAGANLKIMLVRNGLLIELEGDKRPIGSLEYERPFQTHEIDVQEGDYLLAFTDGLKDQFGGNQGKKLKMNGLRPLVMEASRKAMSEQRSFFAKAFDTWKGALEQVDDVCVMGIRI
jgi:two-component system, sensor histidine kinase LadS